MQKAPKIVLYTIIMISTFINKVDGQANWVQTSTPPGGSIWALASIGTNLFAGTSYGVYFSPDDGATWIQRNGAFPTMNVHSFAVNNTDIFAGTKFYGGIYKSSDLGLTWVNITPAGMDQNSFISSLVTDGTSIFAGTEGNSVGIFKSALTGINASSWTTFNTGLPGFHPFYFSIKSLAIKGSTIYAGTYGSGVWSSSTMSANWSATSGMQPAADYIGSLAVSGPVLFAGNLNSTPVLYRSVDNGANWTQSNTAIFGDKPVYSILDAGNIIYAGTEGTGVFRSGDQGISWREFNEGFRNALGNYICIQPNIRSFILKGGTLYAGDDCGVWKRTSAILPATLLSFEAVKNNAGVYLSWKTATESNSDKFEIERGSDGIIFHKIAEIKAAGNSTVTKNYNYVDKTFAGEGNAGTIFYRLKQLDLNGNYIYSGIRSVKIQQNREEDYSKLIIYPNPANDMIMIQVDAALVGSFYSITNATGAKILTGRINSVTTPADVSHLAAGVYFVRIGELPKMTFKLSKL